MDIKQIIRLVLRRWWLFVAFAAIAGGISFYMNYYIYEPVYAAKTTIFVNDKEQNNSQYGIAYDQIMVSSQLIADYAELMMSRTIAQAVIDDLQLKNLTADMIGGMVSVSAKNETRIIEITVTDTDPEMTMKVANSLAMVFSKKAVELMNVANVNIVDLAMLPKSPVGPNKRRNTALAVFAALVFAAGIVLAIEYLDNTIKNSEDVENRLGLTVLGTIPEFRIK